MSGGLSERECRHPTVHYRVGAIEDEVETGLYYLRSRYYAPEMGRFVNGDSLLGSTGGLFSHNQFAYCRNSPIASVDPTGMAQIWTNENFLSLLLDFLAAAKQGSVTMTANGKTITIYGPYAELIAEQVESPKTTYKQSDCQNTVRLVLAGNDLHAGSGSMWMYDVEPKWKDATLASARANYLIFSDCPSGTHKKMENNCPKFRKDHKGHVGLTVWVDWHDGNGLELAVFQSAAGAVKNMKVLWEGDERGGPNITGFSPTMIYFGIIKDGLLGK